jgi:phosphoglycolate phosphatase
LLIIFDLDGTLIDSSKDLAISVNATRQQFGMSPLDELLVHSYVGNGAAVLVRKAMGPDASDELVEQALSFFLKYYRAHALEHTRLYDGIREAVNELLSAGHQLAVLTNKPFKISVDIIAALNLKDHFFRIYGGDSFEAKKPNPTGIFKLMEEAGQPAPETLMVGDSAVDILTARNAGVRGVGVLWGFQPETFALHPPDLLVREPMELTTAIAGAHTTAR